MIVWVWPSDRATRSHIPITKQWQEKQKTQKSKMHYAYESKDIDSCILLTQHTHHACTSHTNNPRRRTTSTHFHSIRITHITHTLQQPTSRLPHIIRTRHITLTALIAHMHGTHHNHTHRTSTVTVDCVKRVRCVCCVCR